MTPFKKDDSLYNPLPLLHKQEAKISIPKYFTFPNQNLMAFMYKCLD